MDIVNHANSVKYLEWCLDCIDLEIIKNQQIKSFEMNYLKELSLGDIAEIKHKTIEQSDIFTVSKGDKINFALQINSK